MYLLCIYIYISVSGVTYYLVLFPYNYINKTDA
jgi:hypothetical protein